MAIDTTYVITRLFNTIISISVFILSLMIYRNTRGASIAYKKWAIGTFLIFVSSAISLLFGLLFGGDYSSETSINEFHRILGFTILTLGYFYLPLGVLHLSKDMKVRNINEETIKKIHILFFSIILASSAVLFATIPLLNTILIVNIVFNVISFTLWVITIIYYSNLYNTLKSFNNCWALLYLALFGSLVNNMFAILYFVFEFEVFEILRLASQIIMAIGFIGGFFKLAKMIEAI